MKIDNQKIDDIYSSLYGVMESKKMTNDEALILADRIRTQATKNIIEEALAKTRGE